MSKIPPNAGNLDLFCAPYECIEFRPYSYLKLETGNLKLDKSPVKETLHLVLLMNALSFGDIGNWKLETGNLKKVQ